MSARLLPVIGLIALATTSVLFSDLTPHVKTATQQQARKLKDNRWKSEPIKITSVTGKDGRRILLGKIQDDDDDWLRDLTISIKNTSNKNILFVELNLYFPRPEGSTDVAITGYPIMFGTPPRLIAESSSVLAPNEKWQASLSAHDYASIRQMLSETGYPASIKEAEIVTGDVLFADRTKWSAGQVDAVGGLSRAAQTQAILEAKKKQ